MFYALDTDHFSAVDRSAAVTANFRRRQQAARGEFFITVITIQEAMRGWLALLASRKTPSDEIPVYARMERSVQAIGEWGVLPWDAEAVAELAKLRAKKIRLGTMDLKIASIVLAHDATLLTRNAVDFSKVPGLRVENWLD